MNQNLQNILNSINQDKNLSEEEKNAIIKSLKDADKEFEITNFKLDRTEKVKRTTAILLEETIEELEQKRKAVEAQNRELEIESSLERVRAVAMSMMKADDLLKICEVQFNELKHLGFSELRNALIGIFHDEKNYFTDYDYSDFATGNIHKIPYNMNSLVDRAVMRMKSANDAFTEFIVEGEELKEWKAFRKQNGEYDDTRIENADILYYYFYSINSGNIGISTFSKISDDQLTILKRFRNVFDLAYRRYVDISNAEAQAKEAKIETALERVRAVAMAMKKSEELVDVCEVMYKELISLDFTNIRNAQIAINNDAKQAYIGFEYSDYSRMVMIDLPYDVYSMMSEVTNEMKKSNSAFFSKEISGKQFEEWRKWRKGFIKTDDPRVETAASMCFYLFSIGTGIIGITSFNPITTEQVETLKRFKNVFELSYQRYTDVARAEAQAREAQIQLALERVRARTMAMQRSDELGETAYVLFQQFEELGEDPEQIGIGIMNEEEEVLELWSTINGKMRDRVVKVPLNEPILVNKLYKAWKEDKKSLIVDISGKDLEDYNHFRNSLVEIKIDISRTKNRRVVSAAYFSKGHISLATTEPRPAETLQLLERFANVFDLTYTRFLDLQKAEAQTKESQIQLALERVRARTMAMQKSDELSETAVLLFHQLISLGLDIRGCGFNIWEKNEKTCTAWMSGPDGDLSPPFNLPLTENPFFIRYYESKQRGEDFWVYETRRDELISRYNYLRTLPVLAELLAKEEEKGIEREFPPFVIDHAVNFSNGNLIFITNQPHPEAWDIFKRFGKVFEQTYTRFLDLQKAEAQAREAQIEVAVERVRAQSMAMHQTTDLDKVNKELYNQLQWLKVDGLSGVSIYFLDDDGEVQIFDLSSPGNIGDPNSYTIKFNSKKYPVLGELYEHYKNAEDYFTLDYPLEKLKLGVEEFRDIDMNMANALEQAIKSGTLTHQWNAFGKISNGVLGIDLMKPPSDDSKTIVMKMAGAFNLAYKRFLDLQKAEAQARESQIEAALERVRSRTMAMQHSGELAETSLILFKQIKELGFETWSCGFCTWQKDNMVEVWMGADSGGLLPPMMIPYKTEPTHKNIYEASLTGVPEHEKIWEGQALEEHYRFLKTIPSVKDAIDILEASGLSLPERQCYYVGFFEQGYLLLITKDPNDELKDLSKRFAKVFNQTYTRFLDLQNSEAQSRESQIQLALERARTQSMIMQHSKELDDTLRVFHEQVLLLNIPSAFSFLWLPDEEHDKHIFWAAWKEEKNGLSDFKSKAINYPLDRNEPATAQCLVDWKGKESIVSYHVPPAGVANYFAAWQELIDGVEQLKPEYFSGGLYYVEAFMKYGCFGVIVTNDLTQDEKKILGRFAIEFERTYRRFLDLQKAEAQAKEAQIEAALEKVRSRSLAMHKSEEILEVVRAVFERLSELNIELNTAFIIIFKENSRDTDWWLINKDKGEYSSIPVKYANLSIMKEMFETKELGKEIFSSTYHAEEKNQLFRYLFTQTDFKYAPPERQKFIFDSEAISISMAMTNKVAIQITRHNERAFSEADNEILKRFTKVFDQSYTRFLDLQKAEAQARESKIEAALERVRSKAMSMQKSEDLAAAITIVFEELGKLDLGMLRCGIGILNKEKRTADVWTTTIADNDTVVQVAGNESMDIHPLLSDAFNAWLKHEDHSYILKGEDLNNYYKAVAGANFILPDSQSLVSKTEGIEQYYFNAAFSAGGLFAFRESPFPEEAKTILRRFADVFTLTYTRFSDLKQAEAQAKEAKIEVALERVRSRTLAMQKSDELAETAAVLFRQLISLGIQPNRLYIAIVKDETGNTEFWITDEDGSKVSSAFETNLNDNATFRKMFDGWKQEKKSLVIDMNGEELQEYFKYLTSIHVPFKGGLTQKRRLQDIAYFSKGFIGMASPDEQPAETLQLLERFAYTFNLTFTRFNDLKLAEAHAIQAEEDLIKLQTEKKRAEDALTELRSTQTQLIQSEKMASLGELTAGIAHEIQNPLNFVNNFSEVSVELIEELKSEKAKPESERDDQLEEELLNDIKQNMQKINHHGKRADAIVKGMLQHSRATSATKEPTDINKLADEYLRLAYHGLRAKDKLFNATLKTDFDETVGNINIIPQDIGRVILNLITNAFYAVAERKKTNIENYEPTVTVKTSQIPPSEGRGVAITVADNGNGIPKNIIDKIFQPFFTTKPTGQGTGLGLSLAYDIVKAHGGELKVETKENEGSAFIIQLPTT